MNLLGREKIQKRYMFYCPECQNLSFADEICEKCGNHNLIKTPKRYGLTNLACISMSVMSFETLKDEYMQKVM